MALAAVLMPASLYSQTVFFKSQQAFSGSQLNEFYSSISIHDDLLFFNASDYNLYAYNKKDGSLKWTCEASYKSNQAPFFTGERLYAGVYASKQQQTAEIDPATGKILKTLPFGPLVTNPLIKDGVLYTTAIYDAGCLIAYDITKDSVLWSRFLAHGYSRQPYYFNNSIIANAEADNWVEINYSGQLLDTACKTRADIYVSDIPCIKKHYGLTHDRKEIKGKLAEKIFGKDFFYEEPQILTTQKNTFILKDSKIYILGDKLKLRPSVPIPLDDSITAAVYSPAFLVKADAETVSLVHSHHLIVYDYHHKKVKQLIDLSAWEPHRVLIDDNKIWLISSKDGLLYGLRFE
jgi:hypothetical protein